MTDWNEDGMTALSLKDVNTHNESNDSPSVGTNVNLRPTRADEYAARAKKYGWGDRQEYNYSEFSANPVSTRNSDVPAGPPAFNDPGTYAGAREYKSEDVEYGALARRYEWKGEYGEMGPRIPELEKELFDDHFLTRRGDHFNVITTIPVTVESEERVPPMERFDAAGLHPCMVENIKFCKYIEPTPIQAYCVPSVLLNHDIIAIAQTGSGKTAAYMIPILSKLMGKTKAKLLKAQPEVGLAEPIFLVIVPTRELAVQIFDEARRLSYRSMLRPCVVYGGGPLKDQASELRKGCDILIGTPGRLIDFIQRGGILTLRSVKYTVLDEADELVSDDWNEDLQRIFEGGDNQPDGDRRFLMFSATFPAAARALAKQLVDVGHIRIRIGRLGSTHRNIVQNVVYCDEMQKRECTRDLLFSKPPARTIIFVNTKRTADYVDDFLFNSGLPSTSLHADRTQMERESAIRGFKSGKSPILVTTGVSARGLDIVNVMHVVNYDLPSSDHGGIHEYIHRIGRTARIGAIGVATSLYNDRNEDLAPVLVKILMENSQPVPEFLEEFMPDGDGELDFEDNSDDEDSARDAGQKVEVAGGATEEPAGW